MPFVMVCFSYMLCPRLICLPLGEPVCQKHFCCLTAVMYFFEDVELSHVLSE